MSQFTNPNNIGSKLRKIRRQQVKTANYTNCSYSLEKIKLDKDKIKCKPAALFKKFSERFLSKG